MSRHLTARLASFVLAALMTVGMLGSIHDFAKAEARLGMANALIAQAGHATPQA